MAKGFNNQKNKANNSTKDKVSNANQNNDSKFASFSGSGMGKANNNKEK